MNPPTAQDFRAAISMLNKLSGRIDNEAAERVMRLPDSRYGDQHAVRIETQTLEQTSRIATVIAQLESWRDELEQQRRQCVSHHV